MNTTGPCTKKNNEMSGPPLLLPCELQRPVVPGAVAGANVSSRHCTIMQEAHLRQARDGEVRTRHTVSRALQQQQQQQQQACQSSF
jgi:hypothetical protein